MVWRIDDKLFNLDIFYCHYDRILQFLTGSGCVKKGKNNQFRLKKVYMSSAGDIVKTV